MESSITFWRGCILFIGRLPELPSHAHLAETLLAGVDGDILIRGSGLDEWQPCRTAYLPSNAQHEIRMQGRRFATLLTEPGTPACDFVRAACGGEGEDGGGTETIILEPAFGERLLEIAHALDSARSEEAIETVLCGWIPGGAESATKDRADARLMQVVETLLASPEEALSAEQLAAAVGMSASWLLHAFKAEFGVPLRRFRTWFRLKATALLMKQGDSLAMAAVGAGFYDQAHFTNAFREMFGIQPGIIFQKQGLIRWFVEDEPATQRLIPLARAGRDQG